MNTTVEEWINRMDDLSELIDENEKEAVELRRDWLNLFDAFDAIAEELNGLVCFDHHRIRRQAAIRREEKYQRT